MKLPTWEKLRANYPALPANVVFEKIGGKVGLNYELGIFSNACAIRVSKALNGSGVEHKIPRYNAIGPEGKMSLQVSSGQNKFWYIFRVKILTKYLSEKYFSPEELTPEEHLEKIKGRKGIIIYQVNGWSDATGHADLWDGIKCVYEGYASVTHKVLFWECA